MQTHVDFDRLYLISVGSFINLCASGHIDTIINQLPFRIAIPSCVCSSASKEIDEPFLDGTEVARLTLNQLVNSRVIDTVMPVSDREWKRFSALSEQKPKTQTQSTHVICALAPEHNCGAISDDLNIHNFGLNCVPPFPVITTARVINIWSETQDIPTNAIGDVFEQAHTRIRYKPSREDPMFAWWLECMETQRNASNPNS